MNFTTLMVVTLSISILVLNAEPNTAASTEESITIVSPESSTTAITTTETSEMSPTTTITTIETIETSKESPTTTTITTASTSTVTPDCGPLHEKANGTFKLNPENTTTIGSNATLECHVGFITDTPTVNCTATGWENATCRLRDCNSPPTFEHGTFKLDILNNTKFGATAKTTCDLGYDAANGTIYCLEKGQWTNDSCVIKDEILLEYRAKRAQNSTTEPAIVCSKPEISHGSVTGNATTEFNLTEAVSCNTGYNLSGDGTIICQANKNWTTIPTCMIKVCNKPTISHGSVSGNATTEFNSTETVSCNTGYNLSGDGTIICQANKTWTSVPTCVIKVCNTPTISHGSVSGNATTEFNSTETVSCNTGYNLSGDGTIICQANKTWTSVPTCVIKVCNTPTISHGSVSGNATTEFNSTETVSCNTGYNLSGDGTIICQANKTWTSVPTCVIKVCNTPTISHGSVSGNATTEFNSTETVSCNTGYNLSGDGTIICQANKTWTSVPTCVIKVCNTPTISHGSVSGNATTEFNSTETVSCNTGYNLSGDGTIICQANKTWTSVPTCVIKVCNTPTISHGSVSGNATTEFNSTETVSCNTGYNLSGNGTITCQANKTWTTVPTCVIKEIQFNESCTPIDGDNPCITDHAVCREEADRGNRCLCNKTFPYFYNDACIAGLNISLTDLKCHVSENPEDGPVPDLIQITCSASSIDEDIFDGYKVRIDNSAREWNFTRANNFIYTLDNLKSGEIYQIDIFATKDSIPSINKKTFHGVTRPVMEANWSLCAITISSFSFQNNDTIVDPFKTFSVEINTTDAKFSANCLSKTTDKATCSILRNESHFNILELNSGSSYEIQIFAQIKFNTKDIRSNGFQRFVIYTVPELPADIEIPLGSITHDSFNVSFENNSNKRFSYWSVSVTNFKTGEWVAEDTRHSDVKSMQISTNITSSTFYLVQVQTHVPMQSSDMFNKTFNTRPRQSSSGHLMKANVTESEIMLFILEDEEERFDYYSLIINSSDAARVTLDGPSNVSCEQSGDNCTFQRTLNFSTKITIKNLTSGTFYPLHLYSRFNGLPSLESQDLSSYTVPVLPDFFVENISSIGFVVGLNEMPTHFLWWNIIGVNGTSFKVPRSNLSYRFENLLSGYQYDLDIFTEVDGFISSENYSETIFTLPSTPSFLQFPVEYIKEMSFKVKVTVPDQRFYNLSITVCGVSNLTCITNAVTNTYCNADLNVTKLLSVENLSAATNYSITAKTALTSDVGSMASSIYYMHTAPHPPSVDLKSVEETRIELNVTGNSDLAFDKYCIKLNSSSCYEIDLDTPGIIIVSNLHAGQNYSLKVYTVWNEIESEGFKEIKTFTKPNPVEVDKIGIHAVTNSTLTVVWEKPIAHTDGYEIRWNCESPNIGTSIVKDQTQITQLLSATASNLDPGTFCNVTITAYITNYDNATLQATSVFKEISSSTFEEAPGIPETLENTDLTSTTTKIELQEPTERNGILRRYDIWVMKQQNETTTCEQWMTYECKDCEGSSPNVSDSVPDTCTNFYYEMFSKANTTFSWNIEQLHPFRDYSAHVVIYTTKPGSVSTITFETLEDVPGKPVELNASTTHDSFTLQWNPPEERNGKVINYTVKATYYEHDCGGFGALQRHSYGVELDPVTKFSQNDLYPFWQYNLTVEATNAIATGKPSDIISVMTKETNSGSVQQLRYQDVSSKSVGLSWTEPCFGNGIITGYSVNIKQWLSHGQEENSYSKTYEIDVANESMSIYDLLPYRNYKVEVYALNSAGDGESSNVSFRTKIDYPDKPTNVSTRDKTSSSLLIEWKKAADFNGPTKYMVHINDSVNSTISIETCTTDVANWTDKLATECNVHGLDAYWEYDIVVDAITFDEGYGELIKSSEKQTFRTAEAVPGPVAHFDVKPEEDVLEERNFRIDWTEPAERDLNGVITGFVIHYQSEKIEVTVGPNTRSKTVLHDVIGSYNVSIQARTSVGPGAPVHKEITVNPGAPIKVDESKNPLMLKASVSVDNDEKQIAVALPLAQFLCNSSNGPPTMWGIVVAEADEAARDTQFAGKKDDFQKKIHDTYKNWFQVDGLNNIPPYIVTKLNWKPPCTNGNRRKRSATDGSNIFVIGNEACHGSSTLNEYCNGPLPDGRSFKVKSFVCTDYGCSESVYSQPIETAPNMTAAFVGGTVSGVVVLVLVITVIFFMRRRQAAKDTESITHTSSEQFGEMGKLQTKEKPVAVYKPGPVKLTNFPDFVEKMHKDSDLLFADAYKAIKEKSPKHPCTTAESQNCRAKNRYTNILSFDHSRVKLRPSDDVDGSDFINANYIPGYTSPREYIATQGPMQATFDDFWRMVWEQNVDTIVMLTKLVEKGRIKCDKYWPDVNEPVYYGDLVVSITSESNLSDYTLRIFEIKMKGEQRSVRQFAYLKWPDMGCPEDPEMLLEFVKSVKEHNKRPPGVQNAGPMIVHCSAGVGRTGTFIVVDHVLQHIRDHDEVDVYKLVLDMRNHRCNMVQTEDQFIYIHECLKAFITTDEDEEEEEPEDEHLYENTRMGEDNIYENTAYQNDSL
ncbi:tyrosine-protein phosphatase 10D-like isoform X2 [Mya arenaria]|uniref:tyrosine-protein phosphatase 10D-like isoform X2 n=1 Tax=Mya arenaria TaxID=6604 RepID=UPI0022E69381|nr:tyrosine-protein phosphatase 10D-like isoform X2 [Mya arenaria]